MKTASLLLAAALMGPSLSSPAAAAPLKPIPLAGQWRFQLDRQDAGVAGRWFDRSLPDRVNLPGALPAQGIGDDITVDTKWTGGIVDRSWFTAPEYARYRQPGNVKVPFWLQPDKYYAGAAWFQRDIKIPADWRGRRVVLSLERPHWETRVWVDGQPFGTNNSLSTPHEYDLGAGLAPGRHTLTVRVDNRMVVDVGHDSHSVSDHTQGNWNGIVGRLELRATPPVWIEDLQVYPRVPTRSVLVKCKLGNATGQPGRGTVTLLASLAPKPTAPPPRVEVTWDAQGGAFESELPLGADAPLWDEFNPNLYQLTAQCEPGGHAKTVTFGLREFAAQGTQFVINGRKTFMRGTLECAIFPRTGHPPTDVPAWKKVIGAAKAYGLNNLRFHSWCPPEAAFVAADELGMYLHVEVASWANSSTTLGDGKPVDQWLYQEADRILKYYGNHPSFVLMPYGNEPGGPNHVAYLKTWVNHYKAKDPRRLYTSAAGWPQIPENQFHLTPDPRIQAWGGGLKSRINALPPQTRADYRDYIAARPVPVISHEIGQWCVYPNFDEIRKYTGYLKPKNFEIFRDSLEAHHLGRLARPFLLASGKLQTLCYKEDIESALRTPGMGGFQLLDLHDFPGQGTALVGVLDPFWESKGYVTPAEYSRFCNSTVPLARLPKRVFTTDETLEAGLEVAHFGPAPLPDAVPVWKIVGARGNTFAAGELSARKIPVDNGIALGTLRAELKGLPAPAQYKLVVGLRGTKFENDWDIWVYPPQVSAELPATVMLTRDLDDQALAKLQAGGTVLWLLPPSRVKGDAHGKVALGFSSIFWNTAWTHRQPPHTLGILCDPAHPLFRDFPTEDHSNWQWWYLITHAGAMILDDLPPALQPTVQVIDDWVTNRRLGLVFEAAVGPGKLAVCSIDLQPTGEPDPVLRQFRASLFRYLASGQFHPKIAVTPEQIRRLTASPSALEKLGARVLKADSEEPGYEAANCLDGNPDTLWHTRWTGGRAAFPHEVCLQFKTPVGIRAVTLLPRQDRNPNGWIKDYELYLSNDPKDWGQPVAKSSFAKDDQPKTITLPAPARAQYLRLVALSAHNAQPYASLAELSIRIDEK
jgi:hypothetical protein